MEVKTVHSFAYITLAKAVGILLVVCGHFTSRVYEPDWYQALHVFIYSFHMPLFMAMSGFLFQHTVNRRAGKIELLPFIGKKFLRLMIPYLFLSFCIAGLNWGVGLFHVVKRPVDWQYMRELFYMDVGGSAIFLWFMYALFVIFIIAACFNYLGKYRDVALGVLAFVLYFIPCTELFFLNYVHTYLFYFWIGMLVYTLVKRYPDLLNYRMGGIAVVCFVLLWTIHPGEERMLAAFYTLLLALFAIWAILCLLKGWEVSGGGRCMKLLLAIGSFSPFIYLLHMAGVYPVRLLMEELFHVNSPILFGVGLLFAMLAGVLFPILITIFVIRKNKVLCFLMGDA
ncbi:MAG: acyltransferase [Tannerellaceae bacterium]